MSPNCSETGSWVPPDYRQPNEKAWCGNCGRVVPVIQHEGSLRYAAHQRPKHERPRPRRLR